MLELDIVGAVEDLTEADLANPPPALPVPTIKRLRAWHHALARNVASGMTDAQAGAACGYTAWSVWRLKQDPTFIELVEHYRRNHEDVEEDVELMIRGLAKKTIYELNDRYEEAPESFSNGEAIELFKLAADRAGFAPITRSVTANLKVGIGAQMDAAQARRMRLKDVTPKEDQ